MCIGYKERKNMKFITLKHIHVGYVVAIDENMEYEQYIEIAKTKFPDLKDSDLFFTDKYGSILEKDILHDFVMHLHDAPEILVAKIRSPHGNSNYIHLTYILQDGSILTTQQRRRKHKIISCLKVIEI